MDELELQIQAELSAITDFLEERFRWRSRWNGEIELSDDSSTHGKALWNGGISINRELAKTDLRWRTEIHEALHLFSVGLNPQGYLDLEGWEEGVVEKLQRLLRPRVLSSLSVSIPETIFAAVEAKHDYNSYIGALDGLREELNEPVMVFYQNLLSTALQSRPALVIQAGRCLPPIQFKGFQRKFALAFSILRGD
jgi:hypothetical protein